MSKIIGESKESQLNELQYDLHCAVDTIFAIQVATDFGPYSAKEWTDAFSMACSTLQEISDKISELAAIKEEKE